MPTLVVEHAGTRRGGVIPGRVLIGRLPTNGISIPESNISRLHAWINRTPDGHYFVGDCGSLTGTFVNGQPVEGQRPLSNGDKIKIGKALATFFSANTLPPGYTQINLAGQPPMKDIQAGGILFDCVCGAPHWVKAPAAGQTQECRHCGRAYIVPSQTGAVAQSLVEEPPPVEAYAPPEYEPLPLDPLPLEPLPLEVHAEPEPIAVDLTEEHPAESHPIELEPLPLEPLQLHEVHEHAAEPEPLALEPLDELPLEEVAPEHEPLAEHHASEHVEEPDAFAVEELEELPIDEHPAEHEPEPLEPLSEEPLELEPLQPGAHAPAAEQDELGELEPLPVEELAPEAEELKPAEHWTANELGMAPVDHHPAHMEWQLEPAAETLSEVEEPLEAEAEAHHEPEASQPVSPAAAAEPPALAEIAHEPEDLDIAVTPVAAPDLVEEPEPAPWEAPHEPTGAEVPVAAIEPLDEPVEELAPVPVEEPHEPMHADIPVAVAEPHAAAIEEFEPAPWDKPHEPTHMDAPAAVDEPHAATVEEREPAPWDQAHEPMHAETPGAVAAPVGDPEPAPWDHPHESTPEPAHVEAPIAAEPLAAPVAEFEPAPWDQGHEPADEPTHVEAPAATLEPLEAPAEESASAPWDEPHEPTQAQIPVEPVETLAEPVEELSPASEEPEHGPADVPVMDEFSLPLPGSLELHEPGSEPLDHAHALPLPPEEEPLEDFDLESPQAAAEPAAVPAAIATAHEPSVEELPEEQPVPESKAVSATSQGAPVELEIDEPVVELQEDIDPAEPESFPADEEQLMMAPVESAPWADQPGARSSTGAIPHSAMDDGLDEVLAPDAAPAAGTRQADAFDIAEREPAARRGGARGAAAPVGTATQVCSICQTAIGASDEMHICPSCGLTFHEECWTENRGCSAYGCPQVNALAPKTDGAKPRTASAATVPSAAPREPGFPTEFVFLAASVAGALLGAFVFGGPAAAVGICTLIYTMVFKGRKRRGVLYAAIVISVIGIVAGFFCSNYFWYGALVGKWAHR